jgi:hypothetical protein
VSELVEWLVESDGPARLGCRAAADRHPVCRWSSSEPASWCGAHSPGLTGLVARFCS